MTLNPELIKLARITVGRSRQKVAFQPPGGDPAAGGAPPMDPSMGGGGAPPMDPSMGGGGMPPMDPSMMGGGAPVPGAEGLTADSIRQIMQETLGQMGMQPGAAGAGGMAGGKSNKDQQAAAMSMDIFQIKKMMSTLFNAMGIPLPQDILDGPNRDPSSGTALPPGTPGSTSDPSRVSPPATGGGGEGGGAAPPGGGGGGDSAIQPIQPMQGAFPAGGGGGEKAGAYKIGESEKPNGRAVRDKAAAIAMAMKRRRI